MTLASPSWMQSLGELCDERTSRWVSLRRHLHQHPELSGHEFATTEHLASELDQLQIPFRVGNEGRGLIADLVTVPSTADRFLIALRGDIDALPIEDQKAVDYRSKHAGVMHACGHDVHATIVLGALEVLRELHLQGDLPRPVAVRGIFQPAEETAQGAQEMIQQHALRDVRSIVSLHVDPTRPAGTVGLKKGMLTAACDCFEVHFHGRGGHGARPHQCRDPIDACTSWVQTTYRRVSRVTDPMHTVVLSIGQLTAGHTANIIPDTATACGSLRSLDQTGRERAIDELQSVCQSITDSTGCRVELKWTMSAPAVTNDAALTQRLYDLAGHVIDPAAASWIEQPSMGSEDFSYYLQHVPGAMFRLGVAGSQVGHEPLHTPNFDVDERALKVGIKLFAAAAINAFETTNDNTAGVTKIS
ncbi:MAG: amidohydrolase [Planctomycetota bacterium]